MGVPKFFRWLSERYPAISQLIAENRIPEFDCLYLDMNGIIHNCTHKDSDSPTFRMTEDKMFIAIFNYIEHLFSKIKPKKLFFMAVDGVAPRAKMNQQRARRFRTALDAEKAKERAIREGVEMPTEDAFDSNCITPGTEFMAKLSKQLKYFVNKKVSEDKDWQGLEIILSGHEVPGEGEHKIMEYIRHAKAQEDYDPNVRHCLYGLDADLVMLGLLSHDPHFCLLREEVTFGRQNSKKSKELEHQNFYLMHLCVVREYLEMEFKKLKEPGVLDFAFDMERVIDDFILMAFFVGNDFLPNLPNLHINEGALAMMFKVYGDMLPKAGGYINERGVINLQRLGLLLDELSRVEYRFFEHEVSDASWFKGKQMEKEDIMSQSKGAKHQSRPNLTMTSDQKGLLKKIKAFVLNRPSDGSPEPLNMSPALKADDRAFVTNLADRMGLQWKTVEDESGNRHLRLNFPPKVVVDSDDDDYDADEEAQLAIMRVIKSWENAKVVDMSAEQAKKLAQENRDKKYEEMFQKWKSDYYKGKFEWGLDNEEEMRKLTENYVQGLQWVLFYYYRGIASWPWFYQYHYSPMISDVKKGLGANMKFTLGQPFKPFEQLMGVLPDRSKKIVPQCYHELMTSSDSPIIDFYPREFELDMNGKKQDWEAVVKIPFIEEKRLLKAMASKNGELTPDEKARNDYGATTKFTYSSDVDFTYPSPLPEHLPHIPQCHCVENIYDLPTMEGLDVHIGLMDGVKLGVSALAGFPSLHTIPGEPELSKHNVNVFQQESRNDSMVLTILDADARSSVEYAKKQLGQRAFVGYPFLTEAKVVRVSDELFDYVPAPTPGTPPIAVPHGPAEIEAWKRKGNSISLTYSRRLGIIIGEVESLVHVEMLKGLKKTDDGATIKEYAVIPGIETDYATQMVVDEVECEDQRFLEQSALPIEQEFPIDTKAFSLGEFGYGRPLQVAGHSQNRIDAYISALVNKEVDFATPIIQGAERLQPYIPSFAVAKTLGLNTLVLSKLTASFRVDVYGTNVNLGLNLKFEAKKLKVLGYSRRGANGWEFSEKAIALIREYMIKFPSFIAAVQANPKGDVCPVTDYFPENEALAKVKELQAWLKSIESKNLEKVPLDAEQLDSEVVSQLEQAADSANTTAASQMKKVKGMPRQALLKPSDAEHRLGNQDFSVGHRVVYVLESGKVPIASRGTIIGILRQMRVIMLDIVFDAPFMSGTTLNDRCSPFRGSSVPSSSVLNLTKRQLEVVSHAGQSRRPQPSFQQGVGFNGYGAPLGPGGRGQLVPAGAPAPLRGSFRGAVASGPTRGGYMNGQAPNAYGNNAQTLPYRPMSNNQGQNQMHGRGRGGPQNTSNRGRGEFQQVNRQGYLPIVQDNIDDTVVLNNPDFRPKYQNFVPPPPSLDPSISSRGRARGRGNGYRGRGGGRGRGRGKENGAAQATDSGVA